MIFKRLEMFGFKSFAEKTKLDFEAGVTVIVGPNGCGKSNISDAIKWVLGEQSVRSLRGASMEDVIFHGADGVEPVGFAEVSLTLSNEGKILPLEYEEITVTRRIFRSGESEYLINKVPVRLKDITDLLMDTGLGIRSYSLMEQGKVDLILSSKPEDRRFIFEEASGITRYKVKKEESLRKLERTAENLRRLEDIIIEVRRQIKSIERQVSRARRYKEEFECLKEYELQVSRHQFRALQKSSRNLEGDIREKENRKHLLDSRMESAVNELERTKQDLSLLEDEISSAQSEKYNIHTKLETIDTKIAVDKERIEELTKRCEILIEQSENLTRKLSSIAEEVVQAQEQIDEIENKKQRKSSLAVEKQSAIDELIGFIKQARQELCADKAKEVEIIARHTRLKNDLTKLATNLSHQHARLRRLNIESERSREELRQNEQKFQVVIEELTALNQKAQLASSEVGELKTSFELKLEHKSGLDSRLEEAAHQITSLQSQLDFLKELVKKHEGFSGGVKSILSAVDSGELQIQGFYGVVANLISVSAQNRLAVEMALGENAQVIVVENDQAASAAIEHLKKEDKGRAHFVCLESLNNQPSGLSISAAARPVWQLINCQDKYQKLARHLFKDTFIVESIEQAKEILKNNRAEFKLITAAGEVLTHSSIIAGSLPRDLQAGLLGRKERIAQTQAELEIKTKEKSEIDNARSQAEKQIKYTKELIQEKEPQLNKINIELANKESEKANIETEKKRFDDENSLVKLEIDETAEEVNGLELEQEKLNQELQVCQAGRDELEARITRLQALTAEKNQEKEDTLLAITQLTTELASADKEKEDARKRLQMLVDSRAQQAQEQELKRQEAGVTRIKIEELKQEIESLDSQVSGLTQRKQQVEQKLQQQSAKRQQVLSDIENSEKQRRQSQKELDALREEESRLQVQLTELHYKQDSLKDRMRQSYQLNLEQSLEGAAEAAPPEDFVYQEVKRLKAKLEGMGSVNVGAIEENDQLQQRFTFLTTQQEDLIKAQDSLRKAIYHINQTARKVFFDTFQKTQEGFKEYFRILFGGGEAKLILLDEHNVLESGIEIVVRPPGKKLQNISLLSGGEKALTAIALLFAIFKVKPSPFCVLDEVDAALDESNIDRFTGLLADFLKTSQFIIITHSKKTINMADLMYGITMQKSGVSKIVSVKFADDINKPKDREVVQVGK